MKTLSDLLRDMAVRKDITITSEDKKALTLSADALDGLHVAVAAWNVAHKDWDNRGEDEDDGLDLKKIEIMPVEIETEREEE